MVYGKDFAGSARRHLAAANQLAVNDANMKAPGNKAVAGYLFGIAGELALKHIMRESGMRPMDVTRRRDDPFYAHFPQLKSLLRDSVQGRRSGELLMHARNERLFQYWDTAMRYAATSDVKPEWTESWKTQAKTLIDTISV